MKFPIESEIKEENKENWENHNDLFWKTKRRREKRNFLFFQNIKVLLRGAEVVLRKETSLHLSGIAAIQLLGNGGKNEKKTHRGV